VPLARPIRIAQLEVAGSVAPHPKDIARTMVAVIFGAALFRDVKKRPPGEVHDSDRDGVPDDLDPDPTSPVRPHGGHDRPRKIRRRRSSRRQHRQVSPTSAAGEKPGDANELRQHQTEDHARDNVSARVRDRKRQAACHENECDHDFFFAAE